MNLAESGFSRGQEVDADDYGTELLKKAGYNPMGLYRAMKAFADNKYVTQPNGFNSHPPTARRLKHLYDKAKSMSNDSSTTNVNNSSKSRRTSRASKANKGEKK